MAKQFFKAVSLTNKNTVCIKLQSKQLSFDISLKYTANVMANGRVLIPKHNKGKNYVFIIKNKLAWKQNGLQRQ